MVKKDNTLHKYLISTSAKVVGKYESENVSIDLSFPDSVFHSEDSPYSRTYMVVTICIPPHGSPEEPITANRSYYGEIFSLLLSILYGKEFKYHGLLETYGMHRLPNMNNEPNPYYTLPFYNSTPRIDLEIPLDLEKFVLIENIIISEYTSVTEEFRKKIFAAGRFYSRAIRIFPNEPELAYLDLITCGEIISSFYDNKFTDDELYDDQLLKYFKEIETLKNGKAIANNIKKRLYQVKRKFTTSLLKNLNEEFFSKTEIINGNGYGRLTKENIESVIKAGYDLRSHYVHEGLEFGFFVTPHTNYFNELVIISSEGVDPKVAKVIKNSPSFLGLERIMRFSLLSLINKNGLPIDEKLNQ